MSNRTRIPKTILNKYLIIRWAFKLAEHHLQFENDILKTQSNFKRHTHVPLKMIWLLKLPCDQNSILINHKLNGNFKSHLIFRGTQEEHGYDT